MAYYLAIDLGTTGCRSIIFDENLKTVASAYEEYGLITFKENWVEQDAELWWTLTLRTAKQAINKGKVNAKDILSLSISSQGITLVPVDERLNPLCNALSWLDTRAESQTKRIREDYKDENFYALTGKPIKSTYTLPKLLWLRENKKDVFEKAYKFLMPMDFLIARFTGRVVTDHSMASGTLMYDLQNGCWDREVCYRYGIDVDKLPEIVWSGTPVGRVRKEVAETLGLSNNCTVAVGGQDQKCAAFGAGVSQKIISVSLGTAAAITRLLTKMESHILAPQISCCGYVIPQTWALEGVLDTAGTCLRYVRDVFYKGETYELINQEVAQCLDVDENVFFYPYLNGIAGKNVVEKPQGCFFGISLSSGRGAYAKAVMEGVAFQLRRLLEQMHAYESGEELILFGGGAKSEIWCQIISDITELPITTLSTAEAAGAGAARLAALGCNHNINSLTTNKKYYPIMQRTEYYKKKYKEYFDLAGKIWNGESE